MNLTWIGRLVAGVVAVWLLPVPAASSAEPVPTTLGVTVAPAYADVGTTVTVSLADPAGPMPGEEVLVERRVAGAWGELGLVTTDVEGGATVTAELSRDPDDNLFRATYPGSATHAPASSGEVRGTLVKRTTRVTVSGPSRIVDESSVRLTVRRRTLSGIPVPGPVAIDRYQHGAWAYQRTVTLDATGTGTWKVSARVDTRWRARGPALAWAKGDTSGVHLLDNVPRIPPVRLPVGAPVPRIQLPPQPRAVRPGPHAVVSRIPDAVWRQMVGRSWHRGCPVGRSGLRLVRINYWAFDGYRRRGELVVAAGAIPKFVGAFSSLYWQKLPLRSMYRVDRFGWSSRLQGADDYRSMAADNTSAFNCRWVVNRPGVRSPHSYGRSVDMNTWENPYRSRTGPVPNSWWLGRSHPLVAWRSGTHDVVRTMRRHGFAWTYGNGDAQHFDAWVGSGRVLARLACGEGACP